MITHVMFDKRETFISKQMSNIVHVAGNQIIHTDNGMAFADLPKTTGRWFPTGFTETRSRAFMETDQVPFPAFLGFLPDLINDGDRYEKLPDVVPYAMLPFGCALILLRFVQAFIRILRGLQDTMIVSHEAEEDVAALSSRSKER